MVYGRGINDSDSPCQIFKWVDGRQVLEWRCPYYELWIGILYRCYSKQFHKRQPTYAGCQVADDWLRFSVFKEWVSQQPLHEQWLNKEGDLQFDKDILLEGNRNYTPEACAFVPRYINTALAYSKNSGLPMGVTKKENRKVYEAGCRVDGKRKYLGVRATPLAAHALWQKQKAENLQSVIEVYSSSEFYNELIAKALQKRVDRILNDLQNGEETTYL
ncbi:conserved hypothetical protein [Salmonella phage PVPSE1]|uniref:Uncharacterized protein 31 n=2 Tax=Seunavirus TaxID=1914851 RepID=G3BLP6_9CAUD|nr:HNH endonuclease [Salmonella phage PVPSE1]ADP02426.1 conserved hypothetical protein [Salmonella phage PVPSE1]QXL90575.1 hypothetical protein [Salmonella phage NINP13076]